MEIYCKRAPRVKVCVVVEYLLYVHVRWKQCSRLSLLCVGMLVLATSWLSAVHTSLHGLCVVVTEWQLPCTC